MVTGEGTPLHAALATMSGCYSRNSDITPLFPVRQRPETRDQRHSRISLAEQTGFDPETLQTSDLCAQAAVAATLHGPQEMIRRLIL